MPNKVFLTSAFVLCILLGEASGLKAQTIAPAIDSLNLPELDTKEILRRDSIAHLQVPEPVKPAKQLASMREIDLNNDGKPEKLRLAVQLKTPIDASPVTFTITSGKKSLFKDSWKAKGYFDTIDHLPDSIKLRRLSRIVNVFFANENFVVIDSMNLLDVLKMGSPADVIPGTPVCGELLKTREVMFSAFQSRDYWYGLMWLPSKKKLIKAWRN
jgi:hypothetical protein